MQALRDESSPRWAEWRRFLINVARGRYRLSAPDAEDVVQKTMTGVAGGLGDLRDPEALLGYMLMALRNEVVEFWRRARRRPPTVPIHEPPTPGGHPLSETIPDEKPSPEDQLHAKERKRLLVCELERICASRRHSERDLRIAIQVFLEGSKSGQVAREMGLNPQTVYNVTHRILEALDHTSLGEVA